MSFPPKLCLLESLPMRSGLTKRKIVVLLTLFLFQIHLVVGPVTLDLADVENEYELLQGHDSNGRIEGVRKLSSSSAIPTDKLDIIHKNGTFDGYNLLVLQRMDEVSRNRELFLIIMDMKGNAVAEKRIGENFYLADCPAEWINATAIMYGTPQGAVIWDYYKNNTVEFDFRGHHEYEYNHRDDTIFTFQYKTVEIGGNEYLFDKIVEYDLSGDVVWSLDTNDFVSPSQGCPFNDTFYQKPDITHSNTVFYDEDYDVIYYNARNLNTFYKINHTNGEILWGLGEYGNFTLFNQTGAERESLFYHAHAVEKIDTNRFIIFDNDFHNQENLVTTQSRILEIEIDETKNRASAVWSWEAPIEYWSMIWGDADRLPNGNTLGVFGTRIHPFSSTSARLVEVNADGEIVWKMDFPIDEGYSYGIYRIERFRYSPSINCPKDFLFSVGENVTVNVNACFNFKPKRDIIGDYILHLNGNLTAAGSITYDRYWRYREFDFALGELPENQYNLTLSFSDGAGHSTITNISVIVSSIELREFPFIIITLACVIGVLGLVFAYRSGHLRWNIEDGN